MSQDVGHFTGVIRRPHERSAGDERETEAAALFADLVELFRSPVAFDRQLSRAGLEVLTDGENVDSNAAQVGCYVEDFVFGLAEAEHQAALGRHAGGFVLHLFEQVERPLILGVAADAVVQPGGRFPCCD